MVKFCGNCGQKLKGDQKFCPVCGEKIQEPDLSGPTMNLEADLNGLQIKSQKFGLGKIFICSTACILIIAILFIMFSSLRKEKDGWTREKGAWTVSREGNLWYFRTKNIDINDSTGKTVFKADFAFYLGEWAQSRVAEITLTNMNWNSSQLNQTEGEVTYSVTMNNMEFQGIVFPNYYITDGLNSSNTIVLSYFAGQYIEDAFSGKNSELKFQIFDNYEFTVLVDEDAHALYNEIKK